MDAKDSCCRVLMWFLLFLFFFCFSGTKEYCVCFILYKLPIYIFVRGLLKIRSGFCLMFFCGKVFIFLRVLVQIPDAILQEKILSKWNREISKFFAMFY